MAVRRIGLDIGATEVRVAEVEFSGKSTPATGSGTLIGFAAEKLPRGTVQAGEIVDVTAVGTAIKKAFAGSSFSSKEVHIGVGSAGVVVREIDLPELPMNQLRTSLPFQVQELLPMSTDEALLDFFPTAEREGESTKLLRGMLVAAPKATVSQHILAIENAGLRPVMVDLNAFALMRAQMTDELRSKIVAFVDIGARVTTVIIANGGMPRLVRILPNGGQDVTDAVATALRISAQEADDVKRNMSIGAQVHPDFQAGQDAVTATSRSLFDSIRNTFVYYSGNNPGEQIAQVVITGGGSHLPGLGQFIASSIRLSVSYGNSFARVTIGKKVPRELLTGREAQLPLPIGLAFGEAS
ncbi:type IV pilus assembly protein PilM [Demequina oxidasica]|uniref:type IV pilus assembly protein PilM n=1 Tax=Demequina oxidasica TaxID=676199 RepID=UPI00078621D3|nr:type IV pilus assembly protein PilM [Demequina oxidasica]